VTGFWKRLTGRRAPAADREAAEAQLESPSERRLAAEGVDGIAADEVVEERLGGVSPERAVDDELEQ
jgi:hypothetical protein